MAALNPPVCDFGQPAHDFLLPATDGRNYRRDDCRGPNGLLLMFICNHCPYVKAIIDRLIRDCQELETLGIGCAAIMSNDTDAYPDDGFPHMQRWSEELAFPFPYLFDADQSVARAYGAVCTPDFFGYNAALELQYRGRLDASARNPGPADAPRELFEAMRLIAGSGQGPRQQTASIGCSIKWRNS
jgi:peroxiredoxin